MKTFQSLIILTFLFLLISCGDSPNKDNEAVVEEVSTEEVKNENSIDLKQNGDYTQLYSLSSECKLTPDQLAEALGFETGNVKIKNTYEGSCWYETISTEGLAMNYGISIEKFPKDIIESEIKRGLEDDMFEMKISESGDTYIKRHPAQGFLLLLNSNYINTIKVSYSYLLNGGEPLTDEQRTDIKANTYKIANFLINHYKS